MRHKRTTTGDNAAMLLGGLAAGIVAGRLLPPLIGILRGSRNVRMGGDPFALLIEDHREMLSFLRKMAEAPPNARMERSRLYLMLKRKLAKHAMAEEDVVYPIVHSQSGERDESKHLYDEHAEMKIRLYELEGKLMAGQDWSEEVRSLTELVRRHAEEEERTIFPQLRSQLAESKLPKVSGQISREEALVV